MVIFAVILRKFAQRETQPAFFFSFFSRHFCTTNTTATIPTNLTHLVDVCTVLYQHQNSPDQKLYSRIRTIQFDLTHEFFLQVCNKFPFSWKPVHRFYLFTLTPPPSSSSAFFVHTTVSVNKVIDVLGKGRNVPLLWDFLQEMSEAGKTNERSYILAARYFAEGRQIGKLVGIFELIKKHDPNGHTVGTLNKFVDMLCRRKLVVEATEVVKKLRSTIPPNGETHGHLISGLCKKGDLIGATKIWNSVMNMEMDIQINCYEEMMVSFFKMNRWEDGGRMFVTMRQRRLGELSISLYNTYITWMCKKGKILASMQVLGEMVKRGFGYNAETMSSILYGLVIRRKVREAWRVLDEVVGFDAGKYDDIIRVYHGLMKGFLRLKRPSDATRVFVEMVERGCEPIMHTYIMLLQGHMGRKGRKDRDPLVNFGSIFVGGLVKVGKTLEATKYVERMLVGHSRGTIDVPRFDYNKFLHSFSNEEGVVMFREVGKKMKEVGMEDLGHVFLRYGKKMTTRDRRRRLPLGSLVQHDEITQVVLA